MTTDICSKLSYDEIIESGYLGKRQALVLSIFSEKEGRHTATEIVKILGRGVSENVRNRITELEQMGFLIKSGIIECQYTHRQVNSFKWTGRTKPLPSREENVICECCHGKGTVIKKVYYDEPKKDLFDGVCNNSEC
jgi:hypothetical protein